jgi:hypothetical protein
LGAIFILYAYLHKKRRNATYSYECENRVAAEKGQALAKHPAESGQSRLLAINVPKRLSEASEAQREVPNRNRDYFRMMPNWITSDSRSPRRWILALSRLSRIQFLGSE